MEPEWMGEHREFLEKLIHYCNIYAAFYKKDLPPLEGVAISVAQIQVIEYLMDNEIHNQNMSSIASKLGITFSTFSKLVNKLEEKGLLEKFYMEGNKKNIVVHVSELGKRVHRAYTVYVYENHLKEMFRMLDTIPQEYCSVMAAALSNPFKPYQQSQETDTPPVLIPCKARKTNGNND